MVKSAIKEYWSLITEALRGEERDYTEGSIRKAIFLLAIPMILELGLESVFAIVDIFFVGKLGSNAIAVVGFTESLITIIYSLAIGLSTAATAIVARRVGERHLDGASQAATQSVFIGIVFSVITGILGWIFADDLLRFMGASEEVVAFGKNFTAIMFGFNFNIFNLVAT